MAAPVAANPYREAIKRLRADPVFFVTELLKAQPEKHQAEVLMACAAGERQITMRSGRRVGKTAMMAWLSLWFEMTRADARTVVTAPSSAQLADAYIPAFRQWAQRLPSELYALWDIRAERFDFRMTAQQGFENFVTVRTARADSPESLQGVNAPHMLVLVDEAAGVSDASFEALSGSMGAENATMVLTGNPNRSTGYFHQTHTTLADRWHAIHVNSEDCGMVSRDWIEEMRLRHGQDSNAYRIHVLGEFPTADDNTLFPLELVEGAVGRDVTGSQSAPLIWGVDVSTGVGADASALCRRRGNVVERKITVWRDLNTMQLAGTIKAEYDSTAAKPDEILIDVIGIGGGVVDRLRELGLPVRGINVSELPSTTGQFVHLKDELHWKALSWLEKRDCQLPNDEALVQELAMIRKDYTSAGKLAVESKKALRRRGVSSPDRLDAFVLTFASEAGTMLHGWKVTPWKQKLRRNLFGPAPRA